MSSHLSCLSPSHCLRPFCTSFVSSKTLSYPLQPDVILPSRVFPMASCTPIKAALTGWSSLLFSSLPPYLYCPFPHLRVSCHLASTIYTIRNRFSTLLGIKVHGLLSVCIRFDSLLLHESDSRPCEAALYWFFSPLSALWLVHRPSCHCPTRGWPPSWPQLPFLPSVSALLDVSCWGFPICGGSPAPVLSSSSTV